MCGLCGVVGTSLYQTEKSAMGILLYLSALRGTDSTGVYVTNSFSGKEDLQKSLGESSAFLKHLGDLDNGSHLFNKSKPNLIMGHCRSSTVGTVSLKNAHPFRAGNLIGMHNGTIEDPEYWPMKENVGKTDSQIMFEAMAKEGIIPVLESLSAKSAFAVSIYDKHDNKLYLARNHRRTLYVGIDKTWGSVFWASEVWMLHSLASQTREKLGLTKMEFYNLQPGVLYELTPGGIPCDSDTPWVATDFKLQEPSKFSRMSSFQNQKPADKPKAKKEEKAAKSEAFIPEFLKPGGVPWWDDNSCDTCGKHIKISEITSAVPIGVSDYRCSSCADKFGVGNKNAASA
ncbi:MAG: class II glutamine amidotransferase [Candidatus Obscuribacterales bacterium]